MTDIVTRLRERADALESGQGTPMAPLDREAADEIERLRALLAASEHYTSVQTKLRDDEVERLITERLRMQGMDTDMQDTAREAADEIERLKRQGFADRTALAMQVQEIERLREQVREQVRELMERPQDDGTEIAYGGEPGASAGKSE